MLHRPRTPFVNDLTVLRADRLRQRRKFLSRGLWAPGTTTLPGTSCFGLTRAWSSRRLQFAPREARPTCTKPAQRGVAVTVHLRPTVERRDVSPNVRDRSGEGHPQGAGRGTRHNCRDGRPGERSLPHRSSTQITVTNPAIGDRQPCGPWRAFWNTVRWVLAGHRSPSVGAPRQLERHGRDPVFRSTWRTIARGGRRTAPAFP